MRVASLERSILRWKRAAYGFGVVLASAVTVAANRREEIVGIVKVRQLEVLNDSGNPRSSSEQAGPEAGTSPPTMAQARRLSSLERSADTTGTDSCAYLTGRDRLASKGVAGRRAGRWALCNKEGIGVVHTQAHSQSWWTAPGV